MDYGAGSNHVRPQSARIRQDLPSACPSADQTSERGVSRSGHWHLAAVLLFRGGFRLDAQPAGRAYLRRTYRLIPECVPERSTGRLTYAVPLGRGERGRPSIPVSREYPPALRPALALPVAGAGRLRSDHAVPTAVRGTKAVVKLLTRLDNEAIDLVKGRTEMPAAVARLVQLVPPGRVDLIDETLVRVGDVRSPRLWSVLGIQPL